MQASGHDFADSIKKGVAQLRSTRSQLLKREAKSKTVRLEAAAMARKNNERLRAVDIEAWYEDVKQHTFRTLFVPIEQTEARAIMKAHELGKNGIGGGDSEQRETDEVKVAKKQHEILLCKLKERIAKAMKSFTPKSMSSSPSSTPQTGEVHVFTKLSSRSPKDSTMCRARALELVKAKLTAARKSGAKIDSNTVKVAIMASTIESLRLKSADEVLECFITSNRVCEDDLPLALRYPKSWSQHIILREWVDISPESELRAFVMDSKLTALCQYYNGAFFPKLSLKDNREKALSIVRKFFNEVKGRIKVEPPEYSMDLAVDLEKGKAYVIELNPFGRPDGMGTGTALFNNKNPEDLKVLFGERPFEFRVEEAPPKRRL